MFAENIDSIYKLIASTAIVVGGVWTYFLYVKKRLGIWNLEIAIHPNKVDRGNLDPLLMVIIDLKNVGSVKIIPGPSGCQLSIKKVPSKLKVGDVINWNTGELILDEKDVLEQYKEYAESTDYENEVYTLDTGCTYHEQYGIIVERDFLYLIEVTFWYRKNKDSMTEYSHIYIT